MFAHEVSRLAHRLFAILGVENGLSRVLRIVIDQRAEHAPVDLCFGPLQVSREIGEILLQLGDIFSAADRVAQRAAELRLRSEEHTSELQSLMRNSYAVLCLKTQQNYNITHKLDQY